MTEVKVNPAGKIAFISGSNRGIGKAITIELLERGVQKVYAGARDVSKLDKLKQEYGDRLVPLQLDVTDINSITKAASQVEDLDILVNNAGISSWGQILSDDVSSNLADVLKVNVWGLVHLSNALIRPLKKESPTAIVNFSSVAGLANMPLASTYSVSKAAVHSITQGMRGELAKDNVLVMGVYPGPIDTDMAAGVDVEKDSPENVASNLAQGLIDGVEDMFPDIMSKQIGEFYASNPKAVEQQFAGYGS
ncbi:MAG: SDR family NAD(P)-dependent oxidoreductase [Bacteroidia bacterium]|nr:SDR family NAD(P)-dependent oxidoreductase [Bacteroidia bacterium]